MANDKRAIKLAEKMGQILEGEMVEDAGAAIGILAAMFIVGFGGKEKQIREGIQALAADAELTAVTIYRARH